MASQTNSKTNVLELTYLPNTILVVEREWLMRWSKVRWSGVKLRVYVLYCKMVPPMLLIRPIWHSASVWPTPLETL